MTETVSKTRGKLSPFFGRNKHGQERALAHAEDELLSSKVKQIGVPIPKPTGRGEEVVGGTYLQPLEQLLCTANREHSQELPQEVSVQEGVPAYDAPLGKALAVNLSGAVVRQAGNLQGGISQGATWRRA